MASSSGVSGKVELLPDNLQMRTDIDKKTRRSAQTAIIVLSENSKLEAQKIFETPLIFSVFEAKGLEYEQVVLFNIISESER